MIKPVNLIQDPDKPIPVEVIAESIVKIAAAMKRIQNSGLNQDALVSLIHRNTSDCSRSQINDVLYNLGSLEKTCLTPRKK